MIQINYSNYLLGLLQLTLQAMNPDLVNRSVPKVQCSTEVIPVPWICKSMDIIEREFRVQFQVLDYWESLLEMVAI